MKKLLINTNQKFHDLKLSSKLLMIFGFLVWVLFMIYMHKYAITNTATSIMYNIVALITIGFPLLVIQYPHMVKTYDVSVRGQGKRIKGNIQRVIKKDPEE